MVLVKILTNDLNIRRISTKFVPHLLIDEQKQQKIAILQELFERAETDIFLKNITGIEVTLSSYIIKVSLFSLI